MGIIYYVTCNDCKVSRDLDKFYSMRLARDRKAAKEIAKEIAEKDSYRAALLASFMWEHEGHNCSVYNENTPGEQDRTFEDRDFWNKE